jgi:hypothetical protein
MSIFSSYQYLNYDAVSCIIDFIPKEQRSVLKTLDKLFYQVIKDMTFSLSLKKLPDGVIFEHLTSYPRLKKLNLSLISLDVQDEHIKTLSGLVGLKELSLEGALKITNLSLSCLNKFPDLEVLNLSCCRSLTNEGFAQLSSLTSLKVLNLSDTVISAVGMELLKPLKNLEVLSLDHCRAVKRYSLAVINDFKKLKVLSMKAVDVTSGSLLELTSLKNLEVLNLGQCQFLKEVPLDLSCSLDSLKVLILAATGLKDANLATLTPLIHLEKLELQHNFITDKGLLYLKPLTKLRHLVLKTTSITGACFADSEIFSKLEVLNLGCSQFNTESNLHFLRRLENMTLLNLARLDIDHEMLFGLGILKKIKVLGLEGCRHVTDLAIDVFSEFPLLKRLKIKETQITQEGIKKINQLIPGICLE